jgi:hypothetical protein
MRWNGQECGLRNANSAPHVILGLVPRIHGAAFSPQLAKKRSSATRP